MCLFRAYFLFYDFFFGKKRHLGGGLSFRFFLASFCSSSSYTKHTHKKKSTIREESQRDVLKVILKAHTTPKNNTHTQEKNAAPLFVSSFVTYSICRRSLLYRKETLFIERRESRLMRDDDASTNTIFVIIQKNVATTQDDDALSETL